MNNHPVGVKASQAYYFAHVLEAMRARQPCAACGRGSTMSTAEIAEAIGQSDDHAFRALHTAEEAGQVESQMKGATYLWQLTARPEPERGNPEAKRIIREVAQHHGITVARLIGRRHFVDAVQAKVCAAHRMRDELGLSLKEIGYELGGLHHSTVHYHLAKKLAW